MVWFKIQGRNSYRAKVCQIPPTHTTKFTDRMSGYEEIMAWGFDQFPVEQFDNYQDWIDTMRNNFIENGKDLDSIFDDSDFQNAEEDFNQAKFGQGIPPELEREEFTSQPVPEIEKPEGIEPVPLFEEEEEEPPEEFEEEEEQGILSKIGNFFRGLFK